MLKATFLLAFFAILAVASASSVKAPKKLATLPSRFAAKRGVASQAINDEVGVMVNSASNPCEYALRDFADAIEEDSCSSYALRRAHQVGLCMVEQSNLFDGKTVNTSNAFEDCSKYAIEHRKFCKRVEPDSDAANDDLSYFSCPTRYPTSAGNKSFPMKGCDNIGMDKIFTRAYKSCEDGDFLGFSLDSLCNNKKCVSALEDAFECIVDRYAEDFGICALVNNTYSFSVFCPEDSIGYKTFTKLNCKDANKYALVADDYRDLA
ncbi:hypothetical protein H696_06159 [Fonticula alba]|uniref:Uncharacterized protein n=1 Tax=Fonticula alba TaxID=691883 RepID=A0A058YZL0_FONAL|nr:hypothetical protein H696_06159 [Fonticula alba]KCV67414.1 hypothetical protein H696_06159 [Fonticula alba]|eukprot:XP_009498180.1 hypothetical protein H696_06159 [Fonticula alba]